jgi:hypothetical protein
MKDEDNPISQELRVAARGRDERTPFIVLVSVLTAVFVVAALVTGLALLVYWLG